MGLHEMLCNPVNGTDDWCCAAKLLGGHHEQPICHLVKERWERYQDLFPQP